ARTCWENMKQFSYDPNAAKPVPYGCRNRTRDMNDKGTKNTVTNATFLRLCLLLYSVTRETPYLDSAKKEYAWFDAWFKLKLGYLIHPSVGAGALIEERPWGAPDYQDASNPTWEKGWIWTGDQGLMLAGLAEYASLVRAIPARRTSRTRSPGVCKPSCS